MRPQADIDDAVDAQYTPHLQINGFYVPFMYFFVDSISCYAFMIVGFPCASPVF